MAQTLDTANEPSVRRSLLLAVGPCPVLKEVPLGTTKDYGGRVIPTRNRALTAKRIEVKPYKWVQELDEMIDENGNQIYLGALTKKFVRSTGVKRTNSSTKGFMVGGEGIEPSLSCENQILSLARLPIPPLAQLVNPNQLYHKKSKIPRVLCYN